MTKIEKIEKVRGRKDIFKIFLDNEEAFLISADTIVKFGLKADLSLPASKYAEVIAFDKSGRAVADALALSAKRSYSFKNLYEKLILKGYEAENAKAAAARLKELNYINDERYAKEYASYLAGRGKGEFAVRAALEKAGIAEDLIKEALKSVKSGEEACERIIRTMKNKFKTFDPKDKNETRKIAAFFFRRGFSSEDIAKAFRKYKNISVETDG